MKKLDDIPKKQPFTVPDEYFDTLPGKIQKRVEAKSGEQIPVFGHVMRYAMAAVVIAALAFVWFWSERVSPRPESAEAILASLETTDLIAYLNEGDITTDELLEGAHLDDEDANEIEGAVFILDLNDADLNALENEIN